MESDREMVWVSLNGASTTHATNITNGGRYWALAKDGYRVARTPAVGTNTELWIHDLHSGNRSKLISDAQSYSPAWSSDGKWIIYGKGIPTPNLWRRKADGSGHEERLTKADGFQQPFSVSPDGRTLLFVQISHTTAADLWSLSLPPDPQREGEPLPSPTSFLSSPSVEQAPFFSNDGRWVAYTSNESGRFEVYVRAFPEGTAAVQLATEGGLNPVWTVDGRQLFYRATNG